MQPADQRTPQRVAALLERGLAASHAGAREVARRYFELVLEQDPDNEQAWLGLARLSESREIEQTIYERVLASDPSNDAARRGLEQLDARREWTVQSEPQGGLDTPMQAQVEPDAEPAQAQAPRPEGAGDEDPGPWLFVPPWEADTPIPIMPELVAAGVASPATADTYDEAEHPGDQVLAAAPDQAVLRGVGKVCDDALRPVLGADDYVANGEARHVVAAKTEDDSAEDRGVIPMAANECPDQTPVRQEAASEKGSVAGDSVEEITSLELYEDMSPRPKKRSRPHPVRDGAMLMMLGFVLVGSLILVFVTGDVAHAQRLRVVLGVVTETPTPTATPAWTLTPTASPTITRTPTPTWTSTFTPSPSPSQTPTFTPAPTATPKWHTAKYLPLPLDEKWIEVELSTQTLIAYDGTREVFRTTISSGRAGTPTLQGKFRIKRKLESQLMTGPGYYLPNVPWVMYFQAGFALHGAYWHDKWGTPTSHGCVNLRREDAKWLYDWTGPVVPEGAKSVQATADNPGTWVLVHE
ncbi:MAG: L,D-transpeptidase family protein [Anaerolineae bacterium]|nr:L,D-transpeptidase family protein [Anaerolineae bacterium]